MKLDPGSIANVARLLQITQHDTADTAPWQPNAEQIRLWEALCEPPPESGVSYILKPRQVGSTSATLLFNVIWASCHDVAKNPKEMAIVWDTQEKGKRQIAKMADWCGQLGIEHVAVATSIFFPNGGRIDLVTAKAGGSTRSLSYQRFHCSELSWWGDAQRTWTGINGSLGLSGECTIETTIEPGDPLPANLWEQDNGFRKIFFRVEDHADYRRDPDEEGRWQLRKDDEELLRGEGFTDRWAMAWWIQRCKTKFAGDRVAMFREYPQLPSHPFLAHEGRWVKVDPEVKEPIEVRRVEGPGGHVWELEMFARIEDTSGHIVLAADTSGGKERDRSAVLGIDARDSAVVCSWASDLGVADDIACVLRNASRRLTVPGEGQRPDKPPVIVVESNGLGEATVRACRSLGLEVREHVTNAGNKRQGMIAARRAIESGESFGPQSLAEDAKSCHIKNGDFRGLKDCLMTLGFALLEVESRPFAAPMPLPPDNVYDLRKRLRPRGRGW